MDKKQAAIRCRELAIEVMKPWEEVHRIVGEIDGKDNRLLGLAIKMNSIDVYDALGVLAHSFERECKQEPNEDLARHIQEGERNRRTYDYTEIEDRISLKLRAIEDGLQHRTSGELEEIESLIDCTGRLIELFHRRNRALESPTSDERPEPTLSGHARRTAPHGQAEGFRGKEITPLPLGNSETKSTTILETIVETMEFETLVAIAKILDVPCEYGTWHDDDFPAHTDELRAAVAEAMGKVGK